nr:hypothetical protein [Desulfobulbaceae bacterium]
MKVIIDKNVVEFSPENGQETASMETLWRMIIDCAGESKKLTPIGEYIPSKQNLLRFTIEGVPGGKTVMSDQTSAADCTYLCAVCNKYMNVKSGDSVPYCCGAVMEAID